MNIFLGPNQQQQVPGDLVARWTSRSDLTPVPRTIEMVLRDKDGLSAYFQEGKVFYSGYEGLAYRVVNINRGPTGKIQGSDMMATLDVTAFLDSCADITYRAQKGIIKENVTLGDVYRACGASARIASDFQIDRFSCFRGMLPTMEIAKLFQESGAYLVLRDGALSMVRIRDMFAQTPKSVIGQVDSTKEVDSPYMEHHELPSFFSVDANGNWVYGNFDTPRTIMYKPRANELVLNNMTRALVTTNVIDSQVAQQIIAGDAVTILGEKRVVVTAAHDFIQDSGITRTRSRFWVARSST